ncbi:hypothetical protein HDU76_000236 [Blyttiomyces sp. JEL0837]|nr:hypothetical protein HDU76_000236 [Blyttiomyces sp. JEL0837]
MARRRGQDLVATQSPSLVSQFNDNRSTSVIELVQYWGAISTVDNAVITTIDSAGFDVQYTVKGEDRSKHDIRIQFDHVVGSLAEAKGKLDVMSAEAHKALSVKFDKSYVSPGQKKAEDYHLPKPYIVGGMFAMWFMMLTLALADDVFLPAQLIEFRDIISVEVFHRILMAVAIIHGIETVVAFGLCLMSQICGNGSAAVKGDLKFKFKSQALMRAHVQEVVETSVSMAMLKRSLKNNGNAQALFDNGTIANLPSTLTEGSNLIATTLKNKVQSESLEVSGTASPLMTVDDSASSAGALASTSTAGIAPSPSSPTDSGKCLEGSLGSCKVKQSEEPEDDDVLSSVQSESTSLMSSAVVVAAVMRAFNDSLTLMEKFAHIVAPSIQLSANITILSPFQPTTSLSSQKSSFLKKPRGQQPILASSKSRKPDTVGVKPIPNSSDVQTESRPRTASPSALPKSQPSVKIVYNTRNLATRRGPLKEPGKSSEPNVSNGQSPQSSVNPAERAIPERENQHFVNTTSMIQSNTSTSLAGSQAANTQPKQSTKKVSKTPVPIHISKTDQLPPPTLGVETTNTLPTWRDSDPSPMSAVPESPISAAVLTHGRGNLEYIMKALQNHAFAWPFLEFKRGTPRYLTESSEPFSGSDANGNADGDEMAVDEGDDLLMTEESDDSPLTYDGSGPLSLLSMAAKLKRGVYLSPVTFRYDFELMLGQMREHVCGMTDARSGTLVGALKLASDRLQTYFMNEWAHFFPELLDRKSRRKSGPNPNNSAPASRQSQGGGDDNIGSKRGSQDGSGSSLSKRRRKEHS